MTLWPTDDRHRMMPEETFQQAGTVTKNHEPGKGRGSWFERYGNTGSVSGMASARATKVMRITLPSASATCVPSSRTRIA